VVRGTIDGYSRMIIYLRCASNNRRLSTVLIAFCEATDIFGIPSQVREETGGVRKL